MNVKIKIINRKWYIFVVLIFIVLISCRTSKLDPNSRVSKLDPNSEKVAVLGEDYTIEKYKIKEQHIGDACLTFDLSTREILFSKYFYLSVNSLPFELTEDKNTITLNVSNGRKYNAEIAAFYYKKIYIYNIEPRSKDSIVIKVRLFDEDRTILY